MITAGRVTIDLRPAGDDQAAILRLLWHVAATPAGADVDVIVGHDQWLSCDPRLADVAAHVRQLTICGDPRSVDAWLTILRGNDPTAVL